MKWSFESKVRTGSWDVLVVDADPATGDIVRQGCQTVAGKVRIATSVDQAAAEMTRRPADLLLVNVQINDNAGLELLRSLRKKYPGTEAIAVSRVRRSELCLDAWRAGAADMIVGPVTVEEVQRSVEEVAHKRHGVERLLARNVRLRQTCRRLNKARHEISQQVDLLCNDLVRAYQEMAQQLNFTQVTTEYAAMVEDELEVEGVLRKTMEWVLKKLGPINAAVYLPDAEHKFALGAYLNLDTQADAELISAVGETLVREADASGRSIHMENDQQLLEHFGEQSAALRGRAWFAAGCFTKRECLAVMVIFRRQGEPLDAHLKMPIESACPLLAEKIEQALELYNRLNPMEDDDPTES